MNSTKAQRKQFVIVKGRYGMGGRLNVLISAMRFARSSGRQLIVDWNDGYYDDNSTNTDTYSLYFSSPPSNAKQFFVKAFEKCSFSVSPHRWQDILHFGNPTLSPGDRDQLYSEGAPPEKDPNTDVVVVTAPTPSIPDFTRQERIDLLLQLRPSPRVLNSINSHLLKQPFLTPEVLGIHVRHGNGENGVIAPRLDWFFGQIDDIIHRDQRLPIFLATDSQCVESAFQKRYSDVFSTTKHYAATGPLHNNRRNVPDPVANGIEALTDLYLLSHCKHLLITGNYFGHTARNLGGGSQTFRCYPEKTRLDKYRPGLPISHEANKLLYDALREKHIRPDGLSVERKGNKANLYYGYDLLEKDFLFKRPPLIKLKRQLELRRGYV